MAKKYIKNEKGIVKSITTDNLQLEKPLLNENYDIEVYNRNMDKIDNAIQEVKGQVSGLELTAERVSIADTEGLFEATNVEDALLENKTSILNNTTLANQALNKANEAFQRGDNVKSQLVDKLISEGLEVSTNQSFEELIGSIALGKRWVSGSLSNSGSFPMTITINANFTPRIAFVHFLGATTQAGNSTSKNIIVKVPEAGGNNPQYIYYNTTEFTTSFNGSTSIIIQKGNSKSSVQGGTIDWIVFE